MSNRKRIVENIICLGMLQVFNYALPLITMPYLVRVLGSEKYGLLAIAQALVQCFVVLTDYGFNMSASRDIAVNRDDPQKVSEITSAVILTKCYLMVISFVLLSLVVFSVAGFRSDWQVYFLWFPMVVGNALFPVWYFQGTEQMRYITVLNVVARSLALASLLVFVRKPNDYLLATGIQGGAFVLGGALSLAVVMLRCRVRIVRPSRTRMIDTIKEGSQVFVSTLSGNVYGQGSVIITGLVVGQAAAGYYKMARDVTNAVSSLIQPVAQAIYPNLSRMFVAGDSGYYRFRRKVFAGGIGIAVCTALAFFAASRLAVGILAGEYVHLLHILFRLMSITLFFTIMNVLINPMILSMKRYMQMQRMYIGAAALFLVVSIPAAFMFGPSGVAVSITMVEVFVFGCSIRIAGLLA